MLSQFWRILRMKLCRKHTMQTFISLFLLLTLVACNEGAFSFKELDVPPTDPTVVTPAGPTVTSITPPESGTYYNGETLTIKLTFSEAVTVSGLPRIILNFSGASKYANYASGSGTSTLTFQYSAASVADMDGIDLLPNIDFNGGSISAELTASNSFAGVHWENVFASSAPGGSSGPVIDNCPGGCDTNLFERPDIVLIERFSATWGASCVGVVLSANYILTAASCVDGALTNSMRVVAGLWDRRDFTQAQVQYVASYKVHDFYNSNPGVASYSNDIAIITLQRPLVIGGNVLTTVLAQPADGNFLGQPTLTYSWIRHSGGNPVTDLLQVWSGANYPVITTAEANSIYSGVADAFVWDDQIAIKDDNLFGGFSRGNGSPMYVDIGGGNYVLAGILSWGLSNGDPNYPYIGTRISSYSAWISANTP